ncbi:MAG: thioredoxin family protein [Planctomycetaceae bacterium]|nr:thioredoxin family protein [Planctomycetaceae bacterium]
MLLSLIKRCLAVILTLIIILFFTFWESAGFAQNTPQRFQLQELYNFDTPLQGQQNQWQTSSRIVADPELPNRAYLLVEVKLAPNWYIYSVTQPKGGPLPTVFTLQSSETFRQIGPFAPTKLHDSKMTEYFDVPIESHIDHVTWVAPIEILKGTIGQLVIEGSYNGQICETGESGMCVPINDEKFRAVFDSHVDPQAVAEVNGAKIVAAQLKMNWPGAAYSAVSSGTSNNASNGPVVLQAQEVFKAEGVSNALFWAFLGGLILNIMPCVFPVIGLKIVSFFDQAGKNRVRAFLLNVWFSMGIVAVFLVLAGLSVGLSTMFTYQLFGIVMSCVVFALALSLMEVWELRAPVFLGTGKSQQLMRQEGGVGAFFKGIITTLLAIPCGAPFLSTAVTWADSQIRSGNHAYVFLAYAVIGFGMAFPYLVIGAFPELLRFLPKPGPWLDTFKKTMGFVLLGAVIWILYFLPPYAGVPTVALMFAVWFGCWMIGRLSFTAKTSERLTAWSIALLVFAAVLVVSFPVTPNPYTLQGAMQRKLDRWATRHDSIRAKIDAELAKGKVVLVDFTADWCLNCKVLERTVLHSNEVTAKLNEINGVILTADWTYRNPEITDMLNQLGGEQVPVVAIFTPENKTNPIVLRGMFTSATLIERLNNIR